MIRDLLLHRAGDGGAMVRLILLLVVGFLVATVVRVVIGACNKFLFALMMSTSTSSPN